MTEEQAIRLVGYLIGGTTGWNDEAAEVYVRELHQAMDDYDAALATVQRIVRTWDEPRRPPIGVILSVYFVERERVAAARAELRQHRPDPHVSPAEGYQIMRAAFREERLRRGKDPDNPPMEAMLMRFGRRRGTIPTRLSRGV